MSPMEKKQIKLAWSAEIGAAVPRGASGLRWDRPDLYVETLRMLEKSGVGFALLREGTRATFNPVVMASILSARTSTIGIVPEVFTTDYAPFKLARLIATLGHVSGGRAGWSLDTSVARNGAHNYGMAERPPEALRDEIAAEYLDVCLRLLRSWEPDAIVEDSASGIFADPSKVNPINFEGRYFRSRGPLNTTTAPHGDPLLVQNLDGPERIGFAARLMDLVILPATNIEDTAAMAAALYAAAAEAGRAPGALKIYAQIVPQIGETAGARACWPTFPTGIVVSGASEAVAAEMEEIHTAAGVDGLMVRGTWSPVQVNLLCNEVFGLLRRQGSLEAPAAPGNLRRQLLERPAA